MFFFKLFFDIRGSTNIINLFYKNLICNHEINHGNSLIDSHCKISMVILKKKKIEQLIFLQWFHKDIRRLNLKLQIMNQSRIWNLESSTGFSLLRVFSVVLIILIVIWTIF